MRHTFPLVFSLIFFTSLGLHPAKGEPAATASSQQIERANPPGSTQPTSYTHLVRAGNMIFMSAITPGPGK